MHNYITTWNTSPDLVFVLTLRVTPTCNLQFPEQCTVIHTFVSALSSFVVSLVIQNHKMLTLHKAPWAPYMHEEVVRPHSTSVKPCTLVQTMETKWNGYLGVPLSWVDILYHLGNHSLSHTCIHCTCASYIWCVFRTNNTNPELLRYKTLFSQPRDLGCPW